LSKLLNFNYTFVEQADGAYGTFNNNTRQWTGMIRRLMDDPVGANANDTLFANCTNNCC
jgi:hypothetical protein